MEFDLFIHYMLAFYIALCAVRLLSHLAYIPLGLFFQLFHI